MSVMTRKQKKFSVEINDYICIIKKTKKKIDKRNKDIFYILCEDFPIIEWIR